MWGVPIDSADRVSGAASQVTHFATQDHMVSASLGWQEPVVARDFLIVLMTKRSGSIWMLDAPHR